MWYKDLKGFWNYERKKRSKCKELMMNDWERINSEKWEVNEGMCWEWVFIFRWNTKSLFQMN